MSAIVSTRYRHENANRLLANLTNNRENYYFFIAKPSAWANENSPESAIDNTDLQNSLFQDMIAMKRVQKADAKLGIRRFNWTTNSIYQYYDDAQDIFDYNASSFDPFFVVTSEFKVYKCLWNNSSRESQVVKQLSFNGATAVGSNKITYNNHGFVDGNKVLYSANSGTAIVGLQNGVSYYVVNKTTNDFQLSATLGGTAIAITAGVGSNHTLLQESFILANSYTVAGNQLAVYKNNIRLNSTQCLKTNSTTVTLVSGVAAANDVIVFEKRGVSTVEPTSSVTGTSAQIVELADGYRWKYMFSLSALDASKFLSTNWIPTSLPQSDDGSDQWDIQVGAVEGVDTIKTLNGGTGYNVGITTGSSVSATSTTIVLANAASSADDYYNGMAIYISSGNGAGQLRVISDYTGSTRTAIVSTWTTIPNSASAYEIVPALTITSKTGTGLTARIPYASIDQTTGAIGKVSVVTIGSGYRDASVSIGSAATVTGTGATFIPVFAPKNGHGNNAPQELGATAVIFNTQLDGSETGQIVADNDYRITGILRNPLTETGTGTFTNGPSNNYTVLELDGGASSTNNAYRGSLIKILSGVGRDQIKMITDYTVGVSTKTATIEYGRTDVNVEPVWATTPPSSIPYGIVAKGNIYNQTVVLTYTGNDPMYNQDEGVTQSGSGATGNVLSVDISEKKIYLINTYGTFTSGSVVGDTTGATATVSSVSNLPIIKHQGEVVAVENRKKVTRSSDQKEDFRTILEF